MEFAIQYRTNGYGDLSCPLDPQVRARVDGRLADPDQIVLARAMTLAITYPLGQALVNEQWVPLEYHRALPAGMTRREFVDALTASYVQIYQEEDATARFPAHPPGAVLSNRHATGGRWNIDAHDLSDLCVSGARFDGDIVRPIIES